MITDCRVILKHLTLLTNTLVTLTLRLLGHKMVEDRNSQVCQDHCNLLTASPSTVGVHQGRDQCPLLKCEFKINCFQRQGTQLQPYRRNDSIKLKTLQTTCIYLQGVVMKDLLLNDLNTSNYYLNQVNIHLNLQF